MDELTDLEHIRKRPGMYVGDTSVWGLHRLFLELLDNTIDQFLVDRATFVRAEANGPLLVFTDDGPGLPFDVPNTPNQSLATYYLTVFRRNLPTADGHVPHVHLSGFGCGLPLVTGLTETCEVTSWRNGDLWHQTLSRGVESNPPRIIERETDGRGTAYRLTVDRGVFDAEWCPRRIDEQLTEAAYLFPGLRVKSPTLSFSTNRGLADLAVKRAVEAGAGDVDQSWWFNDSHGDMLDKMSIKATAQGNAGNAGNAEMPGISPSWDPCILIRVDG